MHETRPWIRKQVINRMAGPTSEDCDWLAGATLAKTPNGFWITWKEQEPGRIAQLPQDTPRTRRCVWLQDPDCQTFERWFQYIASGDYEREQSNQQVENQVDRAAQVARLPMCQRRASAIPIVPLILPLAQAALSVGLSASTRDRQIEASGHHAEIASLHGQSRGFIGLLSAALDYYLGCEDVCSDRLDTTPKEEVLANANRGLGLDVKAYEAWLFGTRESEKPAQEIGDVSRGASK